MRARTNKQTEEQAEEAAREKCLRLLGRRSRSAAELRQRLNEAGFEHDIIETVLAGLERAGLVDDAEFARAWVASRVASGAAGRHKLRWELRRKGIHEDLIRRSVDEGVDDETEVEQALELARRRLRGQPPDASALLRLRRLLLGRGYGFGPVEAALRRLSSQVEELGDDDFSPAP